MRTCKEIMPGQHYRSLCLVAILNRTASGPSGQVYSPYVVFFAAMENIPRHAATLRDNRLQRNHVTWHQMHESPPKRAGECTPQRAFEVSENA